MKVIAMIPARFDSERLPGKLMMDLGGEPLILRTYKNVLKSKLFDKVYVVTDSKLIYDCLKESEALVLMSVRKHISGSDRIAEFSSKISTDIIVNIQGDEPFIDFNSLSKLINLFKKDVNSGFIGTSLELDLRRAGIQRLVVMGFFTNICIETTVRMAGNMGFDTYLVHDACATVNSIGHDGTDYDPDLVHNMAIASLHGEFCTAITTKNALHLCNESASFLDRVQGNE